MPFPDSPRVIYDKNPLKEVICQLRFPRILRIEKEAPVMFQERIRKEYPIFQERDKDLIQIPEELKQSLPADINSLISTGNPIYEFISADEICTVSLGGDFIALTVREYERWAQFKGLFTEPLAALKDIYSPAFYTRVGLRYQNIIRQSELNLDTEWRELLQPYIAGELASSETEVISAIQQSVSTVVIKLKDNLGKVRIRHGLVKVRDANPEICYLIDSDFFTEERTEIDHALELLDTFNRRNGRLFRWCITEKLHRAMGPHSI